MSIYLGLDSSTQSVTATAVEIDDAHPDRRAILFERSFRYDETLPRYGTEHGVLRSADPRTVHAPPLMWSEALDRMMADLARDTGVDWSRLRAISGSAQQHGSVYLNARCRPSALPRSIRPGRSSSSSATSSRAHARPSGWTRARPASAQLSRRRSAGARALARLTGSRAFERFTGPQIRKFAEEDPDAYAATDRIHLVSSWLASLLARRACADRPRRRLRDEPHGPGVEAVVARGVRATAPGLDAKLPPLAESWTVVGTLSPYWQHSTASLPRASWPGPATTRAAWSAPASCAKGVVAISLGTSDTVFGLMPSPRPSDDGTGHVFASPTGAYMGMIGLQERLARARARARRITA